MTDHLTAERRSWNMSRIKSKDTKIENVVRKFLFSKGFRYRKNDKRYPGKPDIVLPKYKTVIFINGCFWHHHDGCKYATVPKTNIEYWYGKMMHNVENDMKHKEQLEKEGWKVIVLWECEIKHNFEKIMTSLPSEIIR